MSTIMKGGIEPTSQKPGQFMGQRIYGSVMDMFVFGRKNCRIVAFEETWAPICELDPIGPSFYRNQQTVLNFNGKRPLNLPKLIIRIYLLLLPSQLQVLK